MESRAIPLDLTSALENFALLEQDLRDKSHSADAHELIKAALGRVTMPERQLALSTKGILVMDPIRHSDLLSRGLVAPESDAFEVLQGDLITTGSAYFMGTQTAGRYMIATSTCDVVKGRRQYASLLRVAPLRTVEPGVANKIGNLLTFRSTKQMYLPPLPGDDEDVLANVVDFDGLAQITTSDLQLAVRNASLGLIGWRLFGALLRTVMVRAGDDEVAFRTQLNHGVQPTSPARMHEANDEKSNTA